MPLSEHEQRLLEQMERALYAEDPKFATSMRSPRSGPGDRRLAAVGVIGFLVGMGLLLAGVTTQIVAVGVVGFLLMVGGIWMAVASLRLGQAASTSAGNTTPGHSTAGHGPAQPAPAAPRRRPRARRPSHGSLTERMEERWRRRREQGDL